MYRTLTVDIALDSSLVERRSSDGVWCDLPKLDDEHSSPGTVLRNLQQVHNADKAAAPGKLGGDIREADLKDLRDDDLAPRKRIPASDLRVRPLPQAHGGRDLTVPNAIAEYPEELHAGVGREAAMR